MRNLVCVFQFGEIEIMSHIQSYIIREWLLPLFFVQGEMQFFITWAHESILQVISEVIVVRDPCFCLIVKPKTKPKKLKDS